MLSKVMIDQRSICNRKRNPSIQLGSQSIMGMDRLNRENISTGTAQAKDTFFKLSTDQNALVLSRTQPIKLFTFFAKSYRESAYSNMIHFENETRYWHVFTSNKHSDQRRKFWEIEEQFARNRQLKIGYENGIQALPIGPAIYVPHHAALKSNNTTAKQQLYNEYAKTLNRRQLNERIYFETFVFKQLCAVLFRCQLNENAFTINVEKRYQQCRIYILTYGSIEIHSIGAKIHITTKLRLDLRATSSSANLVHTTHKDLSSLCLNTHGWNKPPIEFVWISISAEDLKSCDSNRVQKQRDVKTNENPTYYATQPGLNLCVWPQRQKKPNFPVHQLENRLQAPAYIRSRKVAHEMKIKTMTRRVYQSSKEHMLLKIHLSSNWLLQIMITYLHSKKEYWYSETRYYTSMAKINHVERSPIRDQLEKYSPIEMIYMKQSSTRPTSTSILSTKKIVVEQDIIWIHVRLQPLPLSTPHPNHSPAASKFAKLNLWPLETGQASELSIFGQQLHQNRKKHESLKYLARFKTRSKWKHYKPKSKTGQIIVRKEDDVTYPNRHWDVSIEHLLVNRVRYVGQNMVTTMIHRLSYVKMQSTPLAIPRPTQTPCYSLTSLNG